MVNSVSTAPAYRVCPSRMNCTPPVSSNCRPAGTDSWRSTWPVTGLMTSNSTSTRGSSVSRSLMPKGKTTDYFFDPLKIIGTFKVEATSIDGYCVDIYQIEVESIEALK